MLAQCTCVERGVGLHLVSQVRRDGGQVGDDRSQQVILNSLSRAAADRVNPTAVEPEHKPRFTLTDRHSPMAKKQLNCP